MLGEPCLKVRCLRPRIESAVSAKIAIVVDGVPEVIAAVGPLWLIRLL